MTAATRVRLVFYVALLVTVFWMLQVAHTRPPDNRPKPGPTAPARPTR